MVYLPQVTKASHIKDFIIAATFDDGVIKHVDISQWFKGPVFSPLKDKKYFRGFFLDGGSIAWPNGVDIAPEALYKASDVRERHNKRVERIRTRKTRPNRSH